MEGVLPTKLHFSPQSPEHVTRHCGTGHCSRISVGFFLVGECKMLVAARSLPKYACSASYRRSAENVAIQQEQNNHREWNTYTRIRECVCRLTKTDQTNFKATKIYTICPKEKNSIKSRYVSINGPCRCHLSQENKGDMTHYNKGLSKRLKDSLFSLRRMAKMS